MKFYDKNNDTILVITDDDENLLILNKDKCSVTNYTPMAGLEDVFELINFDEDVWINPEHVQGMSFYIGENADEMDSRLVCNLMKVLNKKNYNEVKNDENN